MTCRSPVVVLAASAVLVLAACGGGEGGDGGGSGDASFDPGPVKLAKPGSTVGLGARVFVEYAGLGANNEPTVNTTLAVTVQKVDEGDADDIEGLGDKVVPYYVHVEYENHGDGAISAAAGPGGRFTIRGSDGEDYDPAGVVSIGGEFEECPGADSQATLANGEAVADCVVIDVTEGVSPVEVRFQGDYATGEDPVGWKLE